MSLPEIFVIIIVHWIADFIFQDEKWATGKSKNWNDLLSHTITYSIMWYPFILLFMFLGYIKETNFLWFIPITFVFHTITDYFTSRIVSKKFSKGEYGSSIPNLGAFTIIGFDQVLHYVQLFITYNLLK